MFEAKPDPIDDGTPPNELNPLNPAPSPRLVTGLILPPDRINVILEETIKRIDELKKEMGLEDYGKVTAGSWMDHRRINELQYENDFEWRKASLKGIFKHSNFSLNISKRWARLLSAKVTEDIVGTEPYFATVPTEDGDPQLAKDAEWYVQDAISESDVTEGISEGQRIAIVRNECTMKQYYEYEESVFIGPATIAVGPFVYELPDGERQFAADEPVVTPKGEYIYELDDLIEDPDVSGLFRLQKEPGVAMRHRLIFKSFDSIQQKLVVRDGPTCKPLDYRDFLCPLTVESTDKADLNVHLFDAEIDRMQAQFTGFKAAENYVNYRPESGARAAKEGQGEIDEGSASEVLKMAHYADCYRRCDILGDKQFGELWIIIDLSNRQVVWYDYLANHKSQRPFKTIPGIEKVPNRWYGVGVFEALDHKQLYVDTQFNRVNFKSMKTGSLRFRNKNAVEQWKAEDPFVVGDDQIYDIIDDTFDARNPPFFQVSLSEIDENAMKLLELMLQASSTEIGVVGADDGAVSGLNSTKLATGIKSLERTGNVLMKYTEKAQGRAITGILVQLLEVVLNAMDETQLVFNPKAKALVQLNREEIRKITKKIKLLLTRSRSTETIETARMVVQLCREYYEALTPLEQMLLRPEYIRQLKALEVQDPDALLRETTAQQVADWEKAKSEASTLPPKTSIATKYPDLARSEQVQVLQREGITPAAPQELAAEDQKDLATKQAEAKIEADARPKPASSAKPANRPATR